MTAPERYIDHERLPYFYCPGCGHGRIIDAPNDGLECRQARYGLPERTDNYHVQTS